jgi:hypothetical protein
MTTESTLFTPDMLASVVRTALNSSEGLLVDWQAQPISGGASTLTGAIAGVYRVTGEFRTETALLPWSLILKVIGKGAHGSAPASPGYWRREPLVYQSVLRDNLPPGLAMPRCFAVTETETMCWMWLEDLGEMRATPWSVEQYAQVAYRLGQFNGLFLVQQPLPQWPWLCRQWLHAWVAGAAPETARLPTVREHPLIQRWFPPQDFARILELWERREMLLQVLDGLPHTLCHLDANRRNLISRPQHTGLEVTTLIDWANCGIAALGEELAWLVWASYFLFEVDPADINELEVTTFRHYVAGLRTVGWQGDERDVRTGYAIGSAFRNATALGIDAVLDPQQHVAIEQIFGQPLDLCLARWADVNHRVLNQLDWVR